MYGKLLWISMSDLAGLNPMRRDNSPLDQTIAQTLTKRRNLVPCSVGEPKSRQLNTHHGINRGFRLESNQGIQTRRNIDTIILS